MVLIVCCGGQRYKSLKDRTRSVFFGTVRIVITRKIVLDFDWGISYNKNK